MRESSVTPILVRAGVERVFVQADDGLLAGARFDGQHGETAGSFFNVARALFGRIASGVGRRVYGRRCAETFAGGEINYREHETR